MAKAFYLKMAWTNVKRNKLVYVPYIIATAVISGVMLLIYGLIMSKAVSNLPNGSTATAVFGVSMVVFAIFTVFFMIYMNSFMIGRRKSEFGLYGILGLEKRHVGRILFWETLIAMGAGLLIGVAISLVFGKLLFLVLMKLIHSAPDSSFVIGASAYIITFLIFGGIFVLTTLINLTHVSLSSPIELMRSKKSGDKKPKLVLPITGIGIILLAVAYYVAWTADNAGFAVSVFFLLAVMVIIATYALFTSGSIALLRFLRSKKDFYYKVDNFVTVSGMFHRMRANARGLATICILSTMLIVTVSGTLSLYLGQENILRGQYVYDVEMDIRDIQEGKTDEFVQALENLAQESGITMSGDPDKLEPWEDDDDYSRNNGYTEGEAVIQDYGGCVRVNSTLLFDFSGGDDEVYSDLLTKAREQYFDYSNLGDGINYTIIENVYSARQEAYALFGGLMFMGAFFGVLFLAIAVLVIFFKQVSEGSKDRERFKILQNVGMDHKQIRSTINRQVLWVFFLPLAATLLHMLFASKIMAIMLGIFKLNDWGLVLWCIAGCSVLFILIYLGVYRLTAKVYYKIVSV